MSCMGEYIPIRACNYFVGCCGPTHPSHPMTSSTTSTSRYGPLKFWLLSNSNYMYVPLLLTTFPSTYLENGITEFIKLWFHDDYIPPPPTRHSLFCRTTRAILPEGWPPLYCWKWSQSGPTMGGKFTTLCLFCIYWCMCAPMWHMLWQRRWCHTCPAWHMHM